MSTLFHFGRISLATIFLMGALIAAVTQISVRALGQERIQELIKEGKASRALRAWMDAPLRLLISILVARIGLVAVSAHLLGEAAFTRIGPDWELTGMLVAPIIHVTLGEVLLATWAKHRAEEVAERALKFFMPFDVLLWPVSALLAALARRTAALLTNNDAQATQSGPFLTEDDLARLVGLAPEAGQPAEDPAHKLLQGVLHFHDAVVRDVMVPRTRMLAIDVDSPPDEVIKTFARHGFTRLPVYSGSMDQIIGIIFMTDVVLAQSSGSPLNIRQVMRRPYFVPELMKVEDLLREFQKRRTHMAIVVDEFGGTSGLVTLQDVVEEIVGDVRDEKSVTEASVKELSENVWMMEGRASIDAASTALGFELPKEGGYETLGGFLITRMARLPTPGTVHRYKRFLFRIKEADERRIVKVQVERLPVSAEDEDDEQE